MALHDLSPAAVAFLRFLTGFAVLLPYAWRTGALRGLRGRLRPLLAYTCIELVLASPLIGIGEQRVSTSQTASLLAAVPVTASLGIAACLLAPFALATAPSRPPGAQALMAVAVLGVACSAAAFVAFFALIAAAGPARGSVFTYVLPVVGTAVGVVFLGEHVGPPAVVGLALILVGSRLATRRPRPVVARPALIYEPA